MKLRAELYKHERVLAATRAHPRTLVPTFFLLWLAVMLASFASTLYPSAAFLGILAFVASLVMLVKVIRAVFSWGSKQFFLTNYRVISTGKGRITAVALTDILGMKVTLRTGSKVHGDLLIHSVNGDYLISGIGYPQKFSTLAQQAQQKLFNTTF